MIAFCSKILIIYYSITSHYASNIVYASVFMDFTTIEDVVIF